MKTVSKVLLGVSGAAVLVTGSVLGTLAYLTATEDVTNVFTVGKVGITLTEAEVDTAGQPTGDRTEDGNEYHLIPGVTYVKDPTISVNAGSEAAYVRMLVKVTNYTGAETITQKYNGGDFLTLLGGYDSEVWELKSTTTGTDETTLEFWYNTAVDNTSGTDAKAIEPLFTTLEIPGEATGEELLTLEEGGFKIVVEGHAIQAAGFDDATAAWTAYAAQEANH